MLRQGISQRFAEDDEGDETADNEGIDREP
jgi:hypothetical protein